MASVTPQQKFAAILTLILVASLLVATVIFVIYGKITAQEFLAVWVPPVMMAWGLWFGKQGGG